MRRGFTLLELVTVISILTVLAAMAVPNYVQYRRRAQVAEARMLLDLVGHLEAVHRLETGHYLACPPSPRAVPRGRAEKWEPTPEWNALGFGVESAIRYQLSVEVVDGGFLARARGDLDGDGVASELTLRPGGIVTEKDPLE